MSLTTEMQQKIFESLDDAYGQVKFFQDDVVLLDNDKSDWDNAIFKVDSELYGEIQIVNRAIDDVKDAYNVRFTGVNSCRSDLFWMATNLNDAPTPSLYTFTAVALNENGYTDIVEQLSGNLVGVGSTFFYYLDPSNAVGLVTTSPTNAVTGAEQGTTNSFTHDADTFRFGFAPKNYYGLKYYLDPYQKDIGDTFVTSFIGTVNSGSNQLTVMSPVGSTGQDPGMSPIYKTGQIVTCDKDGVLTTPTKIIGINTGTADLAQIPTTGAAGVVTTNSSTVNILAIDPSAGAGVSAFDSISFSVLDNPSTGPVGSINDVTSNGEVYKPNQKYHAVPCTSNLGGEGATFAVFTNASGGIATTGISTITGGVAPDIIGAGGLGYSVGERITIAGTSIGMGAGTTANDVTFTLRNIQDGRFRYAFLLHEDPIYWPKPSDPQTVGIMQTSNLGIGGRISLDNSGDPKGSQSWDPALEGYEIPMDPTNYRILTKVVAPSVGADKSYWKVGFQTAPIFQSNRVSAGDPTGSIASNALGALLETLSACDSTVDNPINNAIGILTTKEASFTDQDGRNKTMVDATNALREERNDLCMRIWGNRTALGDLNNKITRLESLRGYIEDQTIKDIIE
jgi:hypothetical protein